MIAYIEKLKITFLIKCNLLNKELCCIWFAFYNYDSILFEARKDRSYVVCEIESYFSEAGH